jgi:hypothetical protein
MLTVSKPTSTRSPLQCSQWEKTWKQMLCSSGDGPSRPSPAISSRDRKTVRSYLTGERSRCSPPGARMLSPTTAPTLRPALSTTRTCGPRRSSTRSSPSVTAPRM